MKVYFGGSEYPRAIKTIREAGGQRVMFSYAAVPSEETWKAADELDVMLDSGAFSAWKQGRQIDINEYMEFLARHKPSLYFNLDVVGNIKATWENQKTMEREGFKPIPVFHCGEPWEVLDGACSQYDYVGLGGTVGLPFNQKQLFFEQVFSRFPDHRFHGLGVTHNSLISTFPFYSVDSTWWLFMYRDAGGRLTSDAAHFREEQRARIRRLLEYENKRHASYQMALGL